MVCHPKVLNLEDEVVVEPIGLGRLKVLYAISGM